MAECTYKEVVFLHRGDPINENLEIHTNWFVSSLTSKEGTTARFEPNQADVTKLNAMVYDGKIPQMVADFILQVLNLEGIEAVLISPKQITLYKFVPVDWPPLIPTIVSLLAVHMNAKRKVSQVS